MDDISKTKEQLKIFTTNVKGRPHLKVVAKIPCSKCGKTIELDREIHYVDYSNKVVEQFQEKPFKKWASFSCTDLLYELGLTQNLAALMPCVVLCPDCKEKFASIFENFFKDDCS